MCRMRHVYCFLLVTLLCLASAVSASPDVPRTLEEQTNWLGDVYATSLSDHYPEGLSQDSITRSRDAFVAGLLDTLDEALTSRQLVELTGFVFKSAVVLPYELAPHELELYEDRQTMLLHVQRYIERQWLGYGNEAAAARAAILSPIATVFDRLRQELAREFSSLPGIDTMAAETVFNQATRAATAARDPVTYVLKRPLTEDEMRALEATLPTYALQARQDWEASEARWAGHPLGEEGPSLERARADMIVAASRLASEVIATYGVAPSYLTAEERQVVRDYHRWQREQSAGLTEDSLQEGSAE